MGVDSEIKIAFIGAGNMAREHIKAFASLKSVTLSGIYSRTKEKSVALASDFGISHVCNNIEDLYNKTEADLVVITVSVAAIAKIAKEANSYPWTLFMEKPPAINLTEAEELENTLKENGSDAYVALNRRFLSSTLAALEDLTTDSESRFIYVQDQQPLDRIISLNIHPDNVIEHWMYANCIHLIDYISLFGRGEITKITPLSEWNGRKTNLTLAAINFDSGDKAIYECQWKAPGPWAVTISTANKRWELKPLEHAAYQNHESRDWHQIEQTQADKNFKPGFVQQAAEVIKAVRKKDNNSPNMAEAMKTMRIIQGIYGV